MLANRGLGFEPLHSSNRFMIDKAGKIKELPAIISALAAVSIWGWWMSATRVAATEGIEPIDVAFLRYSIPAILLLPVWLPTLRKLRGAPVWALLAMLGWGAPFLWSVTASVQTANVVYLATIVPCTMPLFAMAAERIFFNFRPGINQLAGFSLIAVAALIVMVSALLGSEGIDLRSLALMLIAAGGWACYVVAFRHTGLTAAQAAVWVCIMSTVVIVVIKLFTGGEFLPLTREQLIFNAFAQGFVSGLVAVLLYTFAIGRLGSARAASFGVLVPAIGALISWLWLAEQPTGMNLTALILGTLGVAIFNNVVPIEKVLRFLN